MLLLQCCHLPSSLTVLRLWSRVQPTSFLMLKLFQLQTRSFFTYYNHATPPLSNPILTWTMVTAFPEATLASDAKHTSNDDHSNCDWPVTRLRGCLCCVRPWIHNMGAQCCKLNRIKVPSIQCRLVFFVLFQVSHNFFIIVDNILDTSGNYIQQAPARRYPLKSLFQHVF